MAGGELTNDMLNALLMDYDQLPSSVPTAHGNQESSSCTNDIVKDSNVVSVDPSDQVTGNDTPSCTNNIVKDSNVVSIDPSDQVADNAAPSCTKGIVKDSVASIPQHMSSDDDDDNMTLEEIQREIRAMQNDGLILDGEDTIYVEEMDSNDTVPDMEINTEIGDDNIVLPV